MKNLLLIAMIMFCIQGNAQFTVWEDDFNDSDVADWTLLDVDGNASNWLAHKNIQIDPNTGQIVDGTIDVLATYNIDLATGSPLEGTEDNWAITPAQDLSFYAGTVQLVINAQTSVYGADQDIFVYISNSADPASFLGNEPITIHLDREMDEGEEFEDHIIDISEYAGAGQPEVYFAIVKRGPAFVGIEIDNIKITATEVVAGIDELTGKTATKIKQNPVAENLQLQLGTTVNAESLNLNIYNIGGMLVKETKYSEAGVSVSDLPGGMYFVVLNDGNATERLKFIKK